MGAVANVRIILDRVTALREGTDPDRGGTREADRAAAAVLAQRNIVSAESGRRLRGLVETATAAAPLPVDLPTERTDEYQAAARALIAWLGDWRETARAVVTRRDYLIRLGLASPRKAQDGTPAAGDVDANEGDDEEPTE